MEHPVCVGIETKEKKKAYEDYLNLSDEMYAIRLPTLSSMKWFSSMKSKPPTIIVRIVSNYRSYITFVKLNFDKISS